MIKDPATLEAESYSKPGTVVYRTIAAGSVEAVDAYGMSYHLISATGNKPVYIATDLTSELPITPGSSSDFPKLFRFSQLSIRNPNTYPVRIALWYGFGAFRQNNIYLTANPSVPLPVVSTQLAGLSGVTLSGNPPADMIRRRSVLISNLDPANPLEVFDKDPAGGGASLFVVFARTIIEYESDAPLYVYNPTASAIQCRIAETWLKL